MRKFNNSIVAIGVLFMYACDSRIELDYPTIENNKIVPLVNTQIDKVLRYYAFMNYTNCSPDKLKKILSTIVKIESQTRYPINSYKKKGNGLILNVTFSDGHIEGPIDISGWEWVPRQTIQPPLLIKIVMKNGMATQVFTNGTELNLSPNSVNNSLHNIIYITLSVEVNTNLPPYIAPNYKAQWDSLK
jgi:hypothetical protein